MTDPKWAPYAVSPDAANNAIHGPLAHAGPNAGELLPFVWQQLQQIVGGFVNEFLRQVAVALGAIEIFGFHPYEALVEIGEEISDATTNFNLLLTSFGLPTMTDVADLLADQANDFATFLAATGQATFAALGAALQALIDFLTAIPANLLSGAMPSTVTLSGTQLGTLLQYINSSGQYAASQLTGAFNTAVTFGGTAASTLFQYLNSSGQFSAAQLTGGLSTAVTFGGTALSTFFQNIDSSGQLLAAGLTGALGTGLTIGGVTLGTLFTNINSSGQLLLSGATGALNTAVTISGNAISTLFNGSGTLASALTGGLNTGVTISGNAISTLFNSSGVLASALTGALNTAVTISGNAISTLFDSSGVLASALTGALNSAVTIGGVAFSALFNGTGKFIGELNGAATYGGNAISALLQNINATGQFLGSAITGSVSAALISGTTTAQQTLQDAIHQILNPLASTGVSAATLATQMQTSLQGVIPAVVYNANGTATALTSAITMNANGTATYVSNGVHALVDQANGTMATVAQSFQQATQAAISQAGSNLTAAAANTQTVLNSLFGAFGVGAGTAVAASTPAQATSAVVSAQQNIQDNAAGLAALNALLTQASNGGGTSISINFSDYSNGSLPGTWTAPLGVYYTSTPTISSGYLVSSPGVKSGALYNTTASVDNSIVSGVFTGVTGNSWPILIGRSNSAGTSYVFALYVAATNQWSIGCYVSGTSTGFGYITETFTPGATYSLVCGTGASGNRVFQLTKNGTALTFDASGATTYTDSGNVSQMGASYRYCGIGVSDSAKCSLFAMADTIPPAAVGSGFRAYRTSTTPVTLSASDNLLGNSFFDTVETVTSDLTSAPATNNKVTVSVDGWYIVTVALGIKIGSGGSAGPALYKNGSVIRHGTMNVSLTGTGYYTMSGTFVVYCAANDYLQPGVYCDAGSVSSVKGESSGTWTYWEIAFANRGTLS